MNILSNHTIAEIVTENINSAEIFKQYGVDFCCGGNISLEEACKQHKIEIEDLIEQINASEFNNTLSNRFNNWSLSFMVDYIINQHHSYVRQSIPIINEYFEKVIAAHGSQHAILIKIEELFSNVAAELVTHLMKEENILFPLIKKIEYEISNNKLTTETVLMSIQSPIKVMYAEHENAGEILKLIRELTENYAIPDWACNTVKALFHKLNDFENDLHIHVHLENNILFKKALTLESNLVQQYGNA